MRILKIKQKKEICVCGYIGEFDKIDIRSSTGNSSLILNACVSDPEHFHKGAISLLVCPECKTVKISNSI